MVIPSSCCLLPRFFIYWWENDELWHYLKMDSGRFKIKCSKQICRLNDCLTTLSAQFPQCNWKWIDLNTHKRVRTKLCGGLWATTSRSCPSGRNASVKSTQQAVVPITMADIAGGLSLVTFHPPVWILAFLTTYGSAFWFLAHPITSLICKRKALIHPGTGSG